MLDYNAAGISDVFENWQGKSEFESTIRFVPRASAATTVLADACAGRLSGMGLLSA